MQRPTTDATRQPRGTQGARVAWLVAAALTLGGCGDAASEDTPDASRQPAVSTPVGLGTLAVELDDALLGLRVRLRLLEHLRSDALGVNLVVEKGEVTLLGTVDEAANRSLAREVALSVDGVAGVSNRIEVSKAEHDEQRPVSRAVETAERELADAVLLARVKLRLAQELGTNALDIDADARDGVVSLRGTLPDDERREIAVATAEAVSGVTEVHDLLDVEG